MGLRDRYQGASSASPAAAPASPAPSAAQPSTPTSEASPAEPSSSPAAASASPTSTPSAKRDLVALRARLSGGTNGGVNPPEATEAVKEDMLEPNTKETPDGGAEPLPNHPDFAKAAATASTGPSDSTNASTAAPKRKRRTKAEMEAARAAAAASATTPTIQAAGLPAPAAAPEASAAALSELTDPVAMARTIENLKAQLHGSTEMPAGYDTDEYRRELAAASAETEGFKILSDDVRTCIESDAVAYYLRNLSLEGAIELVRERMFKGMKTLEIERE